MTSSVTGERVVKGLAGYGIWQEHINRYYFALSFVRERRVLDVACGSGYGTALLASRAELVVGVDVSRDAIILAKKYGKSGLVLADARFLPFVEDCFDTVISYETIEHISYPKEFLTQVKQVLKHAGLLLISSPNGKVFSVNGIPVNPYHVKEFTASELHNLLSLFSNDMEMYGQLNHTLVNITLRFASKLARNKKSSLPSDLILFKDDIQQIDSKYRVKKAYDFYPISTPRFIVVKVTNEKLQMTR